MPFAKGPHSGRSHSYRNRTPQPSPVTLSLVMRSARKHHLRVPVKTTRALFRLCRQQQLYEDMTLFMFRML